MVCMARKTKLTPDVQKEIGQNIILGMPIKFAAEAAGIGETTFYRWMQSGEKAKRGKFREFWEYIKECQAKAVQLHVKLITRAANEGSWQASAWILERRHPNEFGRKDRIDMKADINSSEKDIPLTTEVLEASHRYLKAVAKARVESEKD